MSSQGSPNFDVGNGLIPLTRAKTREGRTKSAGRLPVLLAGIGSEGANSLAKARVRGKWVGGFQIFNDRAEVH